MAIRGVSKVGVGVKDQGRAKKFWSEVIGFTVTTDAAYDDTGKRWVEVTSTDGGTVLILSEDRPDQFRSLTQDAMPTSNVFILRRRHRKDPSGAFREGSRVPDRANQTAMGLVVGVRRF